MPDMIPFVDVHAQYLALRDEIDSAVGQVIAESSFVRGPHVDAFEENFASKTAVEHCISCANGTDALYVALKALGAGPGDEVITTAHSWISTSETITQTGARVVFCDVGHEDFLLDVSLLEGLVTERTKGIVPVHLYGQAVDMDALMEFAKARNLWVLEDCAQAHFATYKERMVGTFGDAATFSFYPGKNLGAMGDAGCILTGRSDLADFMKLFARHGGKGNHKIEGINSRMDGIQAAVLNVKLCKIDQWTEMRRSAARDYDELLKDLDYVITPKENSWNKHVYHLYVVRVPQRDQLKEYLQSKGIGTVINYPRALPFLEAYGYLGHSSSDFPVAHQRQSEILSLPMHPFLSREEQVEVVKCIQSFYE
jgi:dTDP-4-amino-4,6-dideoxygalactose transaminase